MHVIVDSLLTQYETTGAGKTIVLLHGWGDRAAGMRALQAHLAKKYRVIAVDLPGFGGTQAPPAVWGLDDYAQFVAHFLTKIHATPTVIVGHSNGGAIAIRGVALRWLTADKLILLASAGVRGTQKGRLGIVKAITKVGKIATKPLPKAIQHRLRAKVYQAAGSDMLVVEHLQETFKRVVSEDVRADAAKVSVPTLLIYGEQDTQTPPAYGELLHQAIDGSTFELIGDAGHFVHLDQPTRVYNAIEEFIA
jgi:pimeloyl-ACP methyl ester carboxylesterase